MRLERITEYTTIAVAMIFGVLLSLFVGVSTGSGSAVPFIAIGGILAIVVALVMRTRIWLLIPTCWTLIGQVRSIPGSFPLIDIIILYVSVVFFALIALKMIRGKVEHQWLDYLLIANIVYLFCTFLRNPAGTDSMGLGRVGGRPYFDILITFFGYWILERVYLKPSTARRLPFLMLIPTLATTALSFFSFHFPSTVPIIAKFYTKIGAEAYLAEVTGSNTEAADLRQAFLGPFGNELERCLLAYFPPFSLINPLHFWRFAGFLIVVVSMLKSGFRSGIAQLFVCFIVTAYFRSGFRKIFSMGLVVAPILALFLFAQGNLIELPIQYQRALSFLPAKWSFKATDNAAVSTEWRINIWEKVWDHRNHYINNWWFGDGFGYDKKLLVEIMQMAVSGDQEKGTEALVLAGSYHSLPLSTIHAVGYLGFVLFLLLNAGGACYGWKMIRATEATAYYPIGLFIGVQMICIPITSMVLYGDYSTCMINLIFSVSMGRLIMRSLKRAKEEEKAETGKSKNRALPAWPGANVPYKLAN